MFLQNIWKPLTISGYFSR